MVQTIVTSKHEECNLVFTNHGKEDGIYPLRTNNTLSKEIAKAQNRDQYLRSIVKKHAKTPKQDLRFQLIEDTIVLYKDET